MTTPIPMNRSTAQSTSPGGVRAQNVCVPTVMGQRCALVCALPRIARRPAAPRRPPRGARAIHALKSSKKRYNPGGRERERVARTRPPGDEERARLKAGGSLST